MDMKHADCLFKLDQGERNIWVALFKTLGHMLEVLTHNIVYFQQLANSKTVSGLGCF